jgi:hypothetical protein
MGPAAMGGRGITPCPPVLATVEALTSNVACPPTSPSGKSSRDLANQIGRKK